MHYVDIYPNHFICMTELPARVDIRSVVVYLHREVEWGIPAVGYKYNTKLAIVYQCIWYVGLWDYSRSHVVLHGVVNQATSIIHCSEKMYPVIFQGGSNIWSVMGRKQSSLWVGTQ